MIEITLIESTQKVTKVRARVLMPVIPQIGQVIALTYDNEYIDVVNLRVEDVFYNAVKSTKEGVFVCESVNVFVKRVELDHENNN